MRKGRLIAVFVVLTIVVSLTNTAFLCSCSREPAGETSKEEPDEKISVEESDEVADSIGGNLVSANTGFGFEIFKELILEDSNQNIFISPLSILLALAMTYNGAVGDTNLAMAEALRFKGFDLEELNSGFHDLMISIRNADSDIDIAIANSIWYILGYKVKEDFIQRNRKYFDSEVNEIDFAALEAVDTINGWIEEETRGKIEKMLTYIPDDAVMYLINAIYFKGNWTYPFDENLTGDDDFYLLDGTTKKVPMMSQEEEFLYYNGDNFSVTRLSYGQEKMAMYIILPDEGVNLDSVIESLDTDRWKDILESFSSKQVYISMPKYKMEYGIKLLNDVLAKLGMEIAFGSGADFSGISPDIFISKVLHKAVIEVNEKGSEAAAATVVEMMKTAAPIDEIIEFTVDKPFFFVIADDRSGSIIFMGKVVEP